jgi:uncharacterized protein (TIGR03083 family)
MDIRTMIASQRLGLADTLEGLTAEQWDAPSLSEGWSMRHVAAHLVMPFRYSRTKVLLNLIRARGDFNAVADRVARADASLPATELVGLLRDNADSPFKPPGVGYEAPLTELVVHGMDIRHPLGLHQDFRTDTMQVVLNTVTSKQSLKFFNIKLAGIELRATDTNWTYGSGMPVVGSSADLILALCGRPAGIDGLIGEGVQQFSEQVKGES